MRTQPEEHDFLRARQRRMPLWGIAVEGLVAMALVIGAAFANKPMLLALGLVAYLVATFCLVVEALR